MTYPTAAVTTTNADAPTDVPADFRSDILDALQKLNQMIAHTTAFSATLLDDTTAAAARTTLGSTTVGDAVFIAASAAAARSTLAAAASGANSDITSLAGLVGAGLVPVGGIVAFPVGSAPSGYLVIPVAATNISRTTYSALFTLLGTSWGAGDGSTTFGMPWMPANYAMVQANSNVGTSTTGDVKAHTHSFTAVQNVGGDRYPGGSVGASTSSTTGSTGGSDNLAAGVRMVFCIKF